jgi:lysophospholipase L1-like esterase
MTNEEGRGAAGMAWWKIRQAARVAAFGAGGATLAWIFMTGVLMGQAAMARRTIPKAEAPPPRGDGRYGNGHGGKPLTLVMLGDSTASGYGVEKPRQTPGALLATGLAARLRRPVYLRTFAVVGATSTMLAPQVEAAVAVRPDVAVILVGGNDVTHRISPAVAVRHLVEAVRALRAAGARVVVGTCPDLGTIQPIQPPLRWLAGRWSREMAAAQTVAVVEAGGATVSLGNLLGPAFAAEPQRMFGRDGFHPSAEGYAAAAAAMLPTLVAVVSGEAEAPASLPPALAGDEGVRSLPQAAVEAVDTPGTELTGARVAGRERGPAGRWVHLRRRVRQTIRPADPVPNGGHVLSV